ncbi:MAG TPA: undecaprenyl-diphosphate phosphatase [Tepidisphaeraceae bacterium]|jgi:undecaprenyl-diphosphatase|nr:undecaprenyl-diphosphate phosphatase [Tepidisphaeraceae bacterium]
MEMSHALFLGALQGISELFPVSSLAQTILLPALLGWDLGNRERPDFLAFVVALHLATAIALFIYFWNDWREVILAFIGSAKRGRLIYDEPSKFAWLLIAGTIVVGFFGLVFEKKLRQLFEDPRKTWIVAAVLVANGFVMLGADVLKRRASEREKRPLPAPSPTQDAGEERTAAAAGAAISDDERDPAEDAPDQRRRAEELTLIEGASIGATQTFALLPGISRSGVTIAAGLLAGLSYEQATRFSFMLATPVIGLAAALKVPSLFKPAARPMLGVTAASALVAGICAYLSTRFLMRYFRHHRLGPFGWYCIIFGIFSLVMLRR